MAETKLGKIRLADYISGFIAGKGISRVFMIVGGLSMHMNDAFAKEKGIGFVAMHHEQACVMAAEGYARETRTVGVACVTGGPGATNTLTGVVSAHFDSSPCMIFSGQTRVDVIKANGIRQFGVQGFETLPIFKNVSKYAVLIEDPKNVRYCLEKAYYLCQSGRPGVVWIEVPLDVQGALIDPSELAGYDPLSEEKPVAGETVLAAVPKMIELLKSSKRPLLLIGNGVRLSRSEETAINVAERLGLPIITSRNAIDTVNYDHPLFIGHPGSYGTRPANFAAQTCDLLIIVGCRLSMSLTGYSYWEFAKNARKVMVDIDKHELEKPSTAKFDMLVNAECSVFLSELLKAAEKSSIPKREMWIRRCQSWKERYPVVLPEYSDDSKGINSYLFTDRLSALLQPNDTLVVDTSSCFHVVAQAFRVKKGQKYITTGGLSPMGFMLPAAIGVASVKKDGRVVGIVGDGSLQMNIQELQTIVHYGFPIKIFVWNNNGYLLIRHTQNNFQEGRLVGESPKSGLSCPDMQKIAGAYGIPFIRVSKIADLDLAIKQTLDHKGPMICEIITPERQLIIPRVSSEKLPDGTMISKPFADMYPFLGKEAYSKEISVDDLD